MKTVAEYRKNADECRRLAKEVETPEHKTLLERMAETWDRLAAQREKDPQDG